MTRSLALGLVLGLLGFAATAASAGEVRLRTGAVAAGSGPVLLGDVADLTGEDARALAGMVVLDDLAGASAGRAWAEVPLELVRAKLAAAGARLSGLALSGSVCSVRGPAPVEAAGPEAKSEAASDAPVVASAVSAVTVRGEVVRALLGLFGADAGDLRVKFDPQDDGLLSQSVFGRRVVAQPASGAGSSRIVLEVRVYAAGTEESGLSLVASRTIKADVEVRRSVVVLKDGLRRREAILPENLSVTEMWLAPDGSAPFSSIEEAAGAMARSRLAAGTVLRKDQVESPVIVKRNDLVTVHCLSQGFEVKTRARAAADGCAGETIAFRVEGSKRTFSARIESAGVAVVDLSAMESSPARASARKGAHR